MIQLTTACVSSVDETRGNTSNLLFSGQILPERNAGLNGTPTLQLEPGARCVAAVFDGFGSNARKAAYHAAAAFRSAGDIPAALSDLESLFSSIHTELSAAAQEPVAEAPMAASAVAAAVDGDRLCLVSIGSCRAYLMRDKALYLLTRSGADAVCPSQPTPEEGPWLGSDEAAPYTLSGPIRAGDRLLLCTGWLCAAVAPKEMLRAIAEAASPGEALQRIVGTAAGAPGDKAAILLSAEDV